MRRAVLGISALYHDSAAALIVDGIIVAAAQEERFTRVKHDASFPRNAIAYVLSAGNISVRELSAVIFYEKPLLKLERLLETFQAYPSSMRAYARVMPGWLKEKLFLRGTIRRELLGLSCPILFSEHHLSHAASAFYPSPFTEAAILVADAVGEWATTSIMRGEGSTITPLVEQPFPHSLGLLYSAVTAYCGFEVNEGEYKLMGLASYADADDAQVLGMKRKMLDEIVSVKPDGSLALNMEYFSFAVGGAMTHDRRWKELLGIPKRAPETELTSAHSALARAMQEITNDVMVHLTKEAKRRTGSNHLVLAGGVALNCVANSVIRDSGIFDEVWIQPAAGDAGGALGAALIAEYAWFGATRHIDKDAMRACALGPSYTKEDARRMLNAKHARYATFEDEVWHKEIASRLAEGAIVGFFSGRMEWGPRALGHRSILADPRRSDMKERLNTAVKRREPFRPFAPAVLEEDAKRYFMSVESSAYMLFTHEATEHGRNELPAAVHVDGTSRIQTVRSDHGALHRTLKAFKKLTGCSALLNTSFNVRGEPIVMTPEDAYRCFMDTDIDCLAIEGHIVEKLK